MGKKLILAEKPSVAAEIAAALGGFAKVEGWHESPAAIVASAVGHLVEIYAPEAATTGKDLATLPVIPRKFELQPIERSREKFSLVSRLMRRADVDEVVNACDAGREGELIFRLIYELAGCTKPTKRMWLQSMTTDAIRDAYRCMRPGSDYNALGDAARCRSEADWLIGINGSRGLTRLWERQTNASDMVSAGRVQTPTLAILVNNEHRIRAFVPQDYWEVHATFRARAGTYVGKWCRPRPQDGASAGEGPEQADGTRLFDAAEAALIADKCRGVAPSDVKDVSSASTMPPPRLFDLTSLQREVNRRFRVSAKQTLDIAQSLYDKKAISYPRTDATALPEDYLGTAREVLAALDGAAYAPYAARVLNEGWVRPDKRIFDNSKISDHFAIIPTLARPHGLTELEERIYNLIVRRFIAAFFPAAEYRSTRRTTVVAGETFKSSGRVLVVPGWLEVYGSMDAADKTPALCPVVPGEEVRTESVDVRAQRTQPPSRFTEDTLLAAMEGAGKLVDDDELREAMKERGLGTPGTRANIIEGLLLDKSTDKGGKPRAKEPYATREGEARYLVPTVKGMRLIEFLDANDLEALTSPRMTGEWEFKLRSMEQGKYRRAAFMDEIRDMTRSIIEVIRTRAAQAPAAEQVPCLEASACPKCGGAVLAGPRTFECRAGCGFKLWREVCGRSLSDDEGRQLLRDGAIQQLDGFVSTRTKRTFSAGLRLDAAAGKTELVFEDEPAPVGGPAPAALGVPCPKCRSAIHVLPRTYACSGPECSVRLRRQVAGRDMSAAEVERLLQTRSHPTLDGFTSSKGRRFSAALRLNKNLSDVEFQFE